MNGLEPMGLPTGMRVHVPGERRFVKAEGIRPGRPILHTRDEWMDRTRETSRAFLRNFTLAFVVIMLPIWVLLFQGIGDPLLSSAMIVPATLSVVVPLVMVLLERRTFKWQERNAIPSGLYENGILFRNMTAPIFLYVPYTSILGFEPGRSGVRGVLKFKIRGFKTTFYADLFGLLGEDGQAALAMAISDAQDMPRGPPELHVYGGRGARISSVPRDD